MTMGKMNMLLFFLAIVMLGNTCRNGNDDCHKTISFMNNSESAVYVIWESEYPDTLYFGHFSSPALDPLLYKTLAKEQNTLAMSQGRDCWESIFEYGVQIPSDTLMIYVFDAEVIETVPWSTVAHDYMVLKRYDFSLLDLQKMNWTVTYP